MQSAAQATSLLYHSSSNESLRSNGSDAQKPHQSQSPPPTKKPMNSFFLYKQDIRSRIIQEYGVKKNSDISRIASAMWKQEPVSVVTRYKEMADKALLLHKLAHPDFVWPSKSPQYKKLKRRTSSASVSSSISALDTLTSPSTTNEIGFQFSPLESHSFFSANNHQIADIAAHSRSPVSCSSSIVDDGDLETFLSSWTPPSVELCEPIVSYLNRAKSL